MIEELVEWFENCLIDKWGSVDCTKCIFREVCEVVMKMSSPAFSNPEPFIHKFIERHKEKEYFTDLMDGLVERIKEARRWVKRKRSRS